VARAVPVNTAGGCPPWSLTTYDRWVSVCPGVSITCTVIVPGMNMYDWIVASVFSAADGRATPTRTTPTASKEVATTSSSGTVAEA